MTRGRPVQATATRWLVLLAGAALAACGHDVASPSLLVRCAAGSGPHLSLALGEYTTVDANADSGCVTIAANATVDSAEYLVVPQSASGAPGDSAGFTLTSAGPAALTAAMAVPILGRTTNAQLFDALMHRMEATGACPGACGQDARAPGAAVRVASGPPAPGSQRAFRVCGNTTCTAAKTVTAVAQAVGQHIAIYVDTLAPAGGLNAADIDTLESEFDSRLYEVDTTAFGRESDVDSNGVVIVLMTPAVNALVTASQCTQNGYVTGYFLSADLNPLYAAQFNHGEIYYSMVADPAGALSCAHSRAAVKKVTPTTFMHEFEHMINYVQHRLVRGAEPEETWLDEALAKRAEEMGGESYLPGDSTTYAAFIASDLDDAHRYFAAPGEHFLVTTTDEVLADVGAGWLFMRYLVDRYGTGITRTLVQTSLTGATNVSHATGQGFATLVERWGLTNWVSDLPGFRAAPELTYASWAFRTAYPSLHSRDPSFPPDFPLVPTSSTPERVSLAGHLRAGSATYHRVLQPPGGAAFTLQLASDSTKLFPPDVMPQVTVIRIR
jgi:hypothetical protein